jgi:hypothetical protein
MQVAGKLISISPALLAVDECRRDIVLQLLDDELSLSSMLDELLSEGGKVLIDPSLG